MNNSKIYYVRRGQGRKKLLFVHGNMGSSNWWLPVMDALDKQFDMLAVDLRGFGRSQPGMTKVSILDHAVDITALTEELGFFDYVAVGHSLGGAVAMQLAQTYPDLLAALVLVDSAPVAGMKNIDYKLLESVLQQDEIIVASLKGTMVVPVSEELFSLFAADSLKAKTVLIPNTHALEGADFSRRAREFIKPVLVVHGEVDQLVPVAEAYKMAAVYPNSRVAIVSGVGHNPQVENTDFFVRTLTDFMECV